MLKGFVSLFAQQVIKLTCSDVTAVSTKTILDDLLSCISLHPLTLYHYIITCALFCFLTQLLCTLHANQNVVGLLLIKY